MLKKKILFYSLILLSSYIFAEGTLNDVVNSFQDYSLKEIKIKSKGTLEYDYIDDSNFEECWIFNTEKINGIEEEFIHNTLEELKKYLKSKHKKVVKIISINLINEQETIYTKLLVDNIKEEDILFLKIDDKHHKRLMQGLKF